MRKELFIAPLIGLAAVAVALVILGSPAAVSADEGPHIKGWGPTPDDCASCHRAHRAQAERLLIEDQQLLCMTCHGADAMGSVLNVAYGTDEGDGGALRAGGFDRARIDTQDPSLPPPAGAVTIGVLPAPGEPVTSSHTVDGSAQTIWGYGDVSAGPDVGRTDFTMTCSRCHDPHGSGNYRALRDRPSGLVSWGQPVPPFMPNLSGKLADEETKTYTTSNYWALPYTDWWRDSTGDGYADTEITGRQIGLWCTTCHTRYNAPYGEQDSGDGIFAYRHTTDPSTRTASATGPARPQSCLQCHVAHGTNALMGEHSGSVEWPDGMAGGGATDSRLLKMDNRGVCQKCHNK
jgi:predicted CXXCH cytochrome family protein